MVTTAQRRKLLRMRDEGWGIKAAARELGVSYSTARSWVNGDERTTVLLYATRRRRLEAVQRARDENLGPLIREAIDHALGTIWSGIPLDEPMPKEGVESR